MVVEIICLSILEDVTGLQKMVIPYTFSSRYQDRIWPRDLNELGKGATFVFFHVVILSYLSENIGFLLKINLTDLLSLGSCQGYSLNEVSLTNEEDNYNRNQSQN